ncbi:MAG: DUF5127 domain-containing protein [Verrucomicrobiota bacterium]
MPLVTHDPYFSIWSPADKLTDADTVHWTGKPHRLTSLVRIDGKPFRVMGKEPADAPALPQTNLEVLPTRTIYTFEGAGVRLTLTFMTPALPEEIKLLSSPTTYLTYDIQSASKNSHEVQIWFEASGEIAVNNASELANASRFRSERGHSGKSCAPQRNPCLKRRAMICGLIGDSSGLSPRQTTEFQAELFSAETHD